MVFLLKMINEYRRAALVSRASEVECESRSDVAYVAQSLRRLRLTGKDVVFPLKTINRYRRMALVSRASKVECESRSDVAYV